MDAVSNLVSSGKHCTLISSTAYWRVTTDDPSTELSPYTMERIGRLSPCPRLRACSLRFASSKWRKGNTIVKVTLCMRVGRHPLSTPAASIGLNCLMPLKPGEREKRYSYGTTTCTLYWFCRIRCLGHRKGFV